MTRINLTPSDDIQAAIDRDGGPGVEFVLAPGDYQQKIHLKQSARQLTDQQVDALFGI